MVIVDELELKNQDMKLFMTNLIHDGDHDFSLSSMSGRLKKIAWRINQAAEEITPPGVGGANSHMKKNQKGGADLPDENFLYCILPTVVGPDPNKQSYSYQLIRSNYT